MLKKIVAFGASSSKQSINKKLATYAASKVEGAEVRILDLNDFEMPIFSVDRERENGIPDLAHQFKSHLKWADGIVISFAEHNGAYSAAFKNIMDWISRAGKDTWESKPMFLLATSPGKRGGRTVLEIAANKFKFMNPNTIVHFSLPSFHENFSAEKGITESACAMEFENQLKSFLEAI